MSFVSGGDGRKARQRAGILGEAIPSAGTPRQLLRAQTLPPSHEATADKKIRDLRSLGEGGRAKAAKSAERRCRRGPRPAGPWLLDSALLGIFAAIATPFLISVQLLDHFQFIWPHRQIFAAYPSFCHSCWA